MRVTVLGFTVPQVVMDEVVARDVHMPTQTHTFAWAVVRALQEAGVEVGLISAEPLASYPGNSKILVQGGTFLEGGAHGHLLPFVNLTLVKHVTRFISAVFVGGGALRRTRPDAVLVHGVHSPYLLAARVYRRLLGVPVATILTDPPGVVLPSDGPAVAHLKRLDRGLVRRLLRGHDGVVALTAPLADALAPGKPALVMEGILATLPESAPQRERTEGERATTILYAGGLSRAYGVDRLLEAVKGLPDPNVRLRLFGRGELESEIRQASAEDPRIDPPALVARDEILRVYAEADVLVQPRPVDQGFVRYSFPSKLIEYLASGTPVVTTRLPGIPADYDGHVVWAESDDVESLRAAIARVVSTPRPDRAAAGDAARRFVWRTRSPANQGARLRTFIERLPRPRRDAG